MPNPNQPDWIQQELARDQFRRGFYAKLDAATRSAEELQKDFQEKAAQALLAAGLRLIPSQHLEDNEFVVSEGVYQAAKRIVGDV